MLVAEAVVPQKEIQVALAEVAAVVKAVAAAVVLVLQDQQIGVLAAALEAKAVASG